MNNYWATFIFYIVIGFFAMSISQIAFAVFRLYSSKKILNVESKVPSILNFLYFFDKKNINDRYFSEKIKPLFKRAFFFLLIGLIFFLILILFKS